MGDLTQNNKKRGLLAKSRHAIITRFVSNLQVARTLNSCNQPRFSPFNHDSSIFQLLDIQRSRWLHDDKSFFYFFQLTIKFISYWLPWLLHNYHSHLVKSESTHAGLNLPHIFFPSYSFYLFYFLFISKLLQTWVEFLIKIFKCTTLWH